MNKIDACHIHYFFILLGMIIVTFTGTFIKASYYSMKHYVFNDRVNTVQNINIYINLNLIYNIQNQRKSQMIDIDFFISIKHNVVNIILNMYTKENQIIYLKNSSSTFLERLNDSL